MTLAAAKGLSPKQTSRRQKPHYYNMGQRVPEPTISIAFIWIRPHWWGYNPYPPHHHFLYTGGWNYPQNQPGDGGPIINTYHSGLDPHTEGFRANLSGPCAVIQNALFAPPPLLLPISRYLYWCHVRQKKSVCFTTERPFLLFYAFIRELCMAGSKYGDHII